MRQPWAWAIVHGGKDVENRVRNIAGTYRGPVAIHAGLTGISPTDPAWLHAPLPIRPMPRADRLSVRGHVIGVVDLVDVHPGWTEGRPCTPWGVRYVDGAGQWHLELANPRPLATPVRARGRLGLWRVEAEVEQQILDRLAVTP